ncbi:MAG: hypothetical protein OEY56_14780 [Cyclobacteriaceae bacterium]|nr:hypothetical protein [Cyclobacteriaceae bacterium]
MKKLVVLCMASWIFSCQESFEVPVPATGEAYYPLDSNWVREYEISEIDYKISGFDTSHYFLRERTGGLLYQEGEEASYQLIREKRLLATDDWQMDSIWVVRTAPGRLVTVKNNVPEVTLVFPVTAGTTWDLYAFASRNEKLVSYRNVDPNEWEGKNGFSRDSMIQVVIDDLPANIIEQRQSVEFYAAGIGLIEKKSIVLAFCINACDSANQIDNGKYFSQKLVNYGKR